MMARGAGAAERRGWTVAERSELKLLWEATSKAQIGRILGRSEHSVNKAAERFGLKKRNLTNIQLWLDQETLTRLKVVASHHGTTPNRLARSIIEARFTTPLPKR